MQIVISLLLVRNFLQGQKLCSVRYISGIPVARMCFSKGVRYCILESRNMISTILVLQSECINDDSDKGAKKGHSKCFTYIYIYIYIYVVYWFWNTVFDYDFLSYKIIFCNVKLGHNNPRRKTTFWKNRLMGVQFQYRGRLSTPNELWTKSVFQGGHRRKGRRFFRWTQFWENLPIPVGSMGRTVYLPTWMVDFYGFHVGKYAIHGWYGYIYPLYGISPSKKVGWVNSPNISKIWP